jgi:hypothetical protein
VGDENKRRGPTTDAAGEAERAGREARARRLRERIKGIVGGPSEKTAGGPPEESPREFIERRMHELVDEEDEEGGGREE